ncbi:Hypothetical predicted protein [Paramuricea clavata]|uniref:Uncharacterized protein n=1 Tax=Paramuricea clavata TaxID=317549 RepID=A0A7D9I5D8_PARCT|nr:Hypothetical predicted protein [Paramuricea clavata]
MVYRVATFLNYFNSKVTKNVDFLQEVASLLTISSEEHEMGNTCIEQELASTSSQDAETQCDLKILLDAEVHSSEEDTSDSDVTSDSDDDYIRSELDTSDESDEVELKNERNFIVFESMLDQLFINCNTCGSLCEIEKSNTNSMVVIKATCCNNHTFHWESQPEIVNKPAGNILIPSATVITGGSYESMKQFSNALNLNFVNKDQFYDVQDKIVFPVINNAYEKQRKDVIETIKKENTAVNLCVDGRSDSPSRNAKYGTYTLMDEDSGKIIDFSLVQV